MHRFCLKYVIFFIKCQCAFGILIEILGFDFGVSFNQKMGTDFNAPVNHLAVSTCECLVISVVCLAQIFVK